MLSLLHKIKELIPTVMKFTSFRETFATTKDAMTSQSIDIQLKLGEKRKAGTVFWRK